MFRVIGKGIDMALQPVVDAVDILDGVTEGEIREMAALRLGADVIAGLALSEVIEMMTDD